MKRKTKKLTRKRKNPYPEILQDIQDFPKKCFLLGVLTGKKEMYEYFIEGQLRKTIKEEMESILSDYSYLGKQIKNTNILKMLCDDSWGLGRELGQVKACEIILKNNLNINLIRDQWFIVANQIENFE